MSIEITLYALTCIADGPPSIVHRKQYEGCRWLEDVLEGISETRPHIVEMHTSKEDWPRQYRVIRPDLFWQEIESYADIDLDSLRVLQELDEAWLYWYFFIE